MKLYVCIIFSLLSPFWLSAQTLQEWLSPNQTQIEYLIAKSLSLRALNSSIVSGYETFRFGADRVSEIRNGELGSHKNYLHRFSHLFLHPEILTGAQASMTSVNMLEDLIGELKRQIDSGSYNVSTRMAIREKLLALEKNHVRLREDLSTIGLGFSDREASRYERYRLIREEADSLRVLGNKLLLDMQSYQVMNLTNQRSNFFFPVN